jgi:hypothetical protein
VKIHKIKCDFCNDFWFTEEAKQARGTYRSLATNLTKLKNELKALEKGFNPASNKQLAWLMYDAEGFGLAIQRDRWTKKVTTGKQAIERMSKLKSTQMKPQAMKVIKSIKEIEEHERALSMFINVEVDGGGYAHPPYKIHGTVTGRIASGSDKSGEKDKISYKGDFNALNIPDEWREMYVAPPGMVFVAADYRNQEGRAIAWWYKDGNYLEAFRQELVSGPKVHSKHAALIYGIDPKDAKSVMVRFKGGEYSAYDAGKAATHTWAYSLMPPATLMENYMLTREEALRVDDVLAKEYSKVAAGKWELVNKVCGVYEVEEHGFYDRVRGVKDKTKAKLIKDGQRWLANPFGWVLQFEGAGEVRRDPYGKVERVAVPTQANEVLAFPGQSVGASVWARVVKQLGDVSKWGEDWCPVWTGTYDNVILCVPDSLKDREYAIDVIRKVMEQPWPQMDGYSFPVEVSVGYNMRKYCSDNVHGLKEI